MRAESLLSDVPESLMDCHCEKCNGEDYASQWRRLECRRHESDNQQNGSILLLRRGNVEHLHQLRDLHLRFGIGLDD
jgi:hypothetical protein